jgi:transposase
VQPKGKTGKTGKADWAINQIRKLYAVETQAKALDPQARQALREQKSRPLITQLRRWLDTSLEQVIPKSTLGKALHYLDGQWNRLTRFLEDGLIPLDNNPAENAIRPFVVGRKNWLFSHTPSGAHASAAIYSLIETAKVNGLSPYNYLQFVFETLPTLDEDDDLDCLLPWRWKETLPA